MEHSNQQRVKYFWEVLAFKYHLGFPSGVPQPPRPLNPLDPNRGGPMGGMNEGGYILCLTPVCDMWKALEQTRQDM